MEDNMVLYLMIGIVVLSLMLFTCIIILIVFSRKKRNAEGKENALLSGTFNPVQSHHDAHLRTFHLLDDEAQADSSANRSPFENDNNRRGHTEALFGVSSAAPVLNDNSSKTMVLFDDQPSKNKGSSGKLSITYKTSKGMVTFDMKEPIVCIGRDPQYNDIVIDNDKQVGRMHGVIVMRKGKMVYMDLNSKNGSFIKNSKNEFVKFEGILELPSYALLKLANSTLQIEQSF